MTDLNKTSMKYKTFLTASLILIGVFTIAPVIAQTDSSESATVYQDNNQNKSVKSASELNEKRFDNAKASKKEYKSKAKEARRIEREAANASKQANRSFRMEKKAQKARKNAEKQNKKAERAAKKSDRN